MTTITAPIMPAEPMLASPLPAQASIPDVSPEPASAPQFHYLMRLYAPLMPATLVTEDLLVFVPRDGGYVSGPLIKGRILPPAGDWVRTLASGDMRIDVRLRIETDDGAPIFMQYGGVLAKPDAESWSRFLAGARIDAPAWHYVVAPTFETSSKTYSWLNKTQAVGKFVSIQTGENAHVAFDIYTVD